MHEAQEAAAAARRGAARRRRMPHTARAVAVGLREVALRGALGCDHAALSALLKLRQVLPQRVARRLGEMDGAFVHTPRPDEPQITPGMPLELAGACRRGERARLSYRD